MPIITTRRHGVSAGTPPCTKKTTFSTKRNCIIGWSNDAIRRNVSFLRTVYEPDLSGFGYALTFTLRHCPPDYDAWQRLRTNLFMRLRRMELIRLHWVTEWQRRGVPHLHLACYFDHTIAQADFANAWVNNLADHFGAMHRCQYVEPIHDAIGWFQYVSKHAARGLSHYQRSPDAVPRHWTKTGRMWGYTGSWPLCDPVKLDVSRYGFWVFRRIVRRWRIANARAAGEPKRIKSARRMLRCTDRTVSSVRGLSEWIPADLQAAILVFLESNGIECRYRNT